MTEENSQNGKNSILANSKIEIVKAKTKKNQQFKNRSEALRKNLLRRKDSESLDKA